MRALDRETGNLLRAVVQPRAANRRATIAELSTKSVNWEETIEGARQHGIIPILYSEIAGLGDIIPAEALLLAKSEFERNAFHCIANAAELLEVLRAFEKATIAAIPFKGVVLGASAYGDMTARTAGDLDILIYHRDLLRATRILKDRGYELKTNVLKDGTPDVENSCEYHFERADDGMVLELRWRLELTHLRYRHDLGMDWVWPRRRTATLAGADVPHLDPVSELLMLCMHGSKHVWSRLIWICDVAKLLESEPGLDWRSTCQEAERVGLWRCLALGVLLATSVAGARVPGEVLESFGKDRATRRLADFLKDHVAEEPGKMAGGGVPYNIRLLSLRDRVGVVLSPTFFRPNDRDRSVVKLPKVLEPLYYLIRPFRLLLDRSDR